MTSTSVRVALRVRPLNSKETIQNCNECLSFIPDAQQVLIGTDRSFTFDYVFPPNTEQEEVFQDCAQPLIEKLVEGYNVTILAYGQTGSGKTYSMGMDTTLDDSNKLSECQGIIPRAIRKLFEDLNKRKENNPSYQSEVYVSFLELYNEDLLDLLNPQSRESNKKKRNELMIREDANGQIYWAGVKEVPVSSPEDLLGQLQKGSLCRTVASTDMNLVSSRSHAIFSVILKQTKVEDLEENKENDVPLEELSAASKRKSKSKSLTSKIISKFHFVDLAGSERLKRTNAVGDRAKEGIAINGGLLALGNVISALGDESRKVSHIPYRDSKLTRLLQDSLGGNSQTLMLACVSPADSNFMETLNTLKYANRARNIKNKVSVNESYGGNSVEISQLRGQISRLKMEIQTLRAGGCIEEASRQFEEEVKLLKGELGMAKIKLFNTQEQLSNTQEQLSLVNAEKNSLLMQIDSNDQDASDADYERRMKSHRIIKEYEAEILSLKNQVADLQDVQITSVGTIPGREKDRMKFSYTELENDNEKKGKKKKKRSSKKNKSRADGHFPISNGSSVATIDPSKLEDAKNLFSHYIDEEDVEEGFDEESQFNLMKKLKRRNKTREKLERAKEQIKQGYLKGSSVYDDPIVNQLIKIPSSTKSESYIDQMVSNRSKERRRSSGVSFSEVQTVEVPDWQESDSDSPPQYSTRHDSNSSHSTRHNSNSSHSVSFYDQSFSSYSTKSSDDSTDSDQHIALTRMLHQIQSDISVKEQLVSQLERAGQEYIYMKAQCEQKLTDMQESLINLQRERDTAVKRAQNSNTGVSSRDKNSIITELKARYEHKMKRLIQEIGELRRKYNDAIQSNVTSKSQNDVKLKNMRSQIEQLKSEKSRMITRMKEEAKRVRDMAERNQRVIQNLHRKEKAAQEQKKRLERTSEIQKVMLEKRQELVLQTKGKLKSVMTLLKRSSTPRSIAKAFRNNKRNSGGVTHEGLLTSGYDKKKLLDEAIYKYISGRQPLIMMGELIDKRNKLQNEKKGLLEERERIITSEFENEPDDEAQALDEKIEMITSEITYINAKIRALQSEAVRDAEQEENENRKQENLNHDSKNRKGSEDKPRKNKKNSKSNKAEKKLPVVLPENATPETSYDIAVSILRNLDALESHTMLESFFKDIVDLRTVDWSRQTTLDQQEKTITDLRKMLLAMRKTAELAMIECEEKKKELDEFLRLDGRSPSPTTPEKRELQIDGIENYSDNFTSLFERKLEQALAAISSESTETPGQSSRPNSYFLDSDDAAYSSSSPLSGNLLSTSNRSSFSRPSIPSGWLKLEPRERSSAESADSTEAKANRSSASRRRYSGGSESNQNNGGSNNVRRKSLNSRRSKRLSNVSSTSSTPLTPSTPKNENIPSSANISKKSSSRRSSFLSHSRQNSSTSTGFYSPHDSGYFSSNTDKQRRSSTSMVQRVSKDVTLYGRSTSPDSDDLTSVMNTTNERERRASMAHHTHTRSETPSGDNVFDRLSKSQTHSSSAKSNTSAKRVIKNNGGNITGGHLRHDGGVGEALAALEGRRDEYVKSTEPVNVQA